MSDLELRIQRLESKAALQDLIARYFVASDDDDFATLATLFSETATFHAHGQSPLLGPERIVGFIREARTHMGLTIHTPNWTLFEFQNEDHATGKVGAHLELAMGGRSLFGAARYLDTYVRENGIWRFSSRRFQVIHIGTWEDVGTSLTESRCVRWPGGEPHGSEHQLK
ncbi:MULTISPECIES: nuclear transport factor 2 family protein [Pseudomonas]|uniref:Aminoglycoside nucleotidyltransferase ANT9 n=1 Tax=Pseudomonas monteilii TaxID=76759 RepID=A0AAE6RDF0_9PSED|nr:MULTISPECIES: nuclear transport factor 2 family protein [Pseudomonas]MDH4549906.1 nuclear transport factor 2 family protein [Pseudomonas sp. BN607]QHB28818.1 aminoglycoside nucleotidyltransferase ANT9 [Pseudomonas monteilii]